MARREFEDLVTGDDDVGEDGLYGQELSGQELGAAMGLRPAQVAALAKVFKASQQPKITGRPGAEKVLGERVIGFTRPALGAGATDTINIVPQQFFRGERIVTAVPTATFTIDDIKIMTRSQFAGNAPVPAEVFAASAFGVRLRMDPVEANVPIAMTVTNISGAPATLYGAIIGTSGQ